MSHSYVGLCTAAGAQADAQLASSHAKKKIEMHFAHLKRAKRFDRLRGRSGTSHQLETISGGNIGPKKPMIRVIRC